MWRRSKNSTIRITSRMISGPMPSPGRTRTLRLERLSFIACRLYQSQGRRDDALGVRAPGRGFQKLYLLGHHERAEFCGETLDEILVREHRGPMRPAIGVVLEFPQMDELVDRARIGLEIADQLLVLAALLQRRIPEFLVELDRLRHRSDAQCIGSHLIESHRAFPP